jgi:hypothetical protein
MKAGNARTTFTHRISAVKGKTRSPLATAAIDEIWRRAAAQVGFQLARTGDAYATSDGQGGIAIGAAETLDDDDALAQLVFHELCHAVTEGEAAQRRPDWGLDNVPEHVVREHACLRVQASLAERFGLRAVMAPTTPYRDYYASLPGDPLLARPPDDGDAATRAATAACARFDSSSWRGPIEQALRETAAAIGIAVGVAPGADRHPLGFRLGSPTLRHVRLAVRGRAGRRRPALPPERARERRRRPHRAHPPGLRALGTDRRLPHLRRVLSRGLPFRHRVDARSSGLAGARSDRAARRAFRDSPGRLPLRGVAGGRGEQLHLRDL